MDAPLDREDKSGKAVGLIDAEFAEYVDAIPCQSCPCCGGLHCGDVGNGTMLCMTCKSRFPKASLCPSPVQLAEIMARRLEIWRKRPRGNTPPHVAPGIRRVTAKPPGLPPIGGSDR